ncbi:TraV family lipoprotein [Methylocaldum szegediense]|jgi:conjugal transfer pilus assembly protein TraV|uniref:TraV family lipoprotein n=1 Tax=Methylocaldum szegediense TaxID=73780 RepID=UPI00040BFD3B|nr:TraV family lipoprotein [Methylocaldum szegediense]
MKRLLGFVMAAALSGCATKYGCKGMPNDPICMSTREAYKATNHVSPSSSEKNQKKGKTARTEAPAGAARHQARAPYPKIDDPTPIRTPSSVMRIWIAPWEDTDGDLVVSSYVYTELQPRRWVIGQTTPANTTSLVPLQVEHRPKATSPRKSAESAGVFTPTEGDGD